MGAESRRSILGVVLSLLAGVLAILFVVMVDVLPRALPEPQPSPNPASSAYEQWAEALRRADRLLVELETERTLGPYLKTAKNAATTLGYATIGLAIYGYLRSPVAAGKAIAACYSMGLVYLTLSDFLALLSAFVKGPALLFVTSLALLSALTGIAGGLLLLMGK